MRASRLRRRRRATTRALLPLAAAAGAYWLPGAAPIAPPVAWAVGLRRRADHTAGIALTFDDGPHPHGTPAILEILSELKVTATFFLVGEQVERRPALAATILAGGHEIGVHCFRHRCLLRVSPRQTKEDLTWAVAAIAAVGARPCLYRPPYGVANLAALAVARRNGWTPLLWTRDGHDWQKQANATSISDRLLRRISAGDVILLHDSDHYSAPGSWRATAQALPRILRELRERGYHVGSYGEIAANAAKSGIQAR
jgi:peptidoglycan-N-acetylglucosamine deacetylase